MASLSKFSGVYSLVGWISFISLGVIELKGGLGLRYSGVFHKRVILYRTSTALGGCNGCICNLAGVWWFLRRFCCRWYWRGCD